MRKKNLLKRMTALMAAGLLAVVTPMGIMAENTGNDVTGKSVEEISAETDPADELKNPVYHDGRYYIEDYTDSTDWSYITFGSYPQTEVRDNALKTRIDEALSGSDTGDVEIDGEKYRKIALKDTNRLSYYDDYSKFGIVYYYYKWEPIKWRVLSEDDEKLFVCSDNIIEAQEYNESQKSVIWETATIRKWLNGDSEFKDPDRPGFTGNSLYNTAFTEDEQASILETTIKNPYDPYLEKEDANDTKDKVFLLSYEDVYNEDYGFRPYSPGYDGASRSTSRKFESTDYAKQIGDGATSVWLRNPNSDVALILDYSSRQVYDYSYYNTYYGSVISDCGVVPALCIKRSSDCWKAVEDNSIKNPEYHEGDLNVTGLIVPGSDKTDWSYIYFGAYPMTEITDETLMAKIDNELRAEGYETGDIIIDGVKFRKVDPDDANSNNDSSWCLFDENGEYVRDENRNRKIKSARYFRWERIKWKVLNVDNVNKKLFICADNVLDSQQYQESKYSYDRVANVTWETSTIRDWLNGNGEYDDPDRIGFTGNSFYNTAFSEEERSAIIKTLVRNDAVNPLCSTDGGNDTNDNVFLLSYEDVINQDYGFRSVHNHCTYSRAVGATDYAEAMGVRRAMRENGNRYPFAEGNSSWWLRSPGRSNYAIFCEELGIFEWEGHDVTGSEGIVPAMYLDLSSEAYGLEDDGASGSCGGPIINNGCEIAEPVNDTVIVTYNANGGTGEMTAQTVKKEIATALSTNAFTKEGYDFIGWATDSNATTPQYENGASITATEDTTLYAIWKVKESEGGDPTTPTGTPTPTPAGGSDITPTGTPTPTPTGGSDITPTGTPTPTPTGNPVITPTDNPAIIPSVVPSVSPTSVPQGGEEVSAPKKAGIASVKNSKKGKVSLKIKDKDADGYEIVYATNRKFAKSKKKTISGTSVKLKKLIKGKTYYIKVRAFNKKNDSKVYGAWSKVKKITI